MRRLTNFILLLLLLSPALYLRADEQQTTDNNPSYQITVTGDRLEEPVNEKSDSVSVITRDQIDSHQWQYVIDALRTVPGVSIVQSGSPGKTSSIFVRGAGSTQVLVLLDGIPVNDPYFGQVQLESLVTDNVERIEVLKGPQSPLYGSDAMSGVIQIFTRRGGPGNKMNASFEGGSYDTFRERAGISGRQKDLDYSVSFSRQDSNGQLQNDDFGENAFVASGGYRFTNADRMTFTGQVFDANTGLPYGFGFVPSPHQRQDNLQQLFGGSYHHDSGSLFHLNTALSFTRLKYHFEDPDNVFTPFSDSKSGVLQFTTQNDAHLAEWNTLTAGYEYERQKINASDNTGPYIRNMVIGNNAVFVQDKVETDSWIATAGFRWDHYSTFGNTVNPRISLGYKPLADVKIRGSYGRAFRAPSAGELALPYYGNPDLKPEKSRSWEIGVDKYWKANTTFTAAWFDNHYEDLISFDPQTFLAVNIAEATTRGLELSAATHYGRWTYSAGYTYLNTRDELTGLRLFRRPTHSANFSCAYDTPRWGAALSLLGVGDRLETDYSSFPFSNVLNPGYGKLDVTGYYQVVSALKLQMRIENVLNKDYEEALGYKALGRGVYAGIAGTF